MKTALILFKNPLERLDSEYLNEISSCIINGGFSLDLVEVLSLSDDLGFKRSFTEYKERVDVLIIVNNDGLTFDVKKIIADQTETNLIENDNAVSFLEAVKKAHGKEYSDYNAVIPMEATLIPNLTGAFQGFMLDDEELTTVLLPQDKAQFTLACDRYLLPYLDKKYNLQKVRMTFKYFGAKSKLESAIALAKELSKSVEINYQVSFGDYTISLVCDKECSQDVARVLVSELKEDLYADCNVSLGERLFDLLKLKNLKMATAESFTGGRVVSSVIKNAGASSYVYEGIVCYTNHSKSKRLDIELDQILKNGAVSSMTAYRMCAGLLKDGNADVVISTTGFAGPKQEQDDQTGLAYIGVGMMDGVHTYKLNLTGSREEITETAKNTALFLAIKKLKSIK